MADGNDANAGGDEKIIDAGADKGADDKGTIVDAGKSADDKGADAGGDKGQQQPDWRAQMAGEDAEAAKRLARFASPGDVFKSFRSLETKISSGEYRKPLDEKATPEQKAEWRKANGLPDKADEYVAKLALPNGLVLGEAEKPILSALAEVAHDRNMAPDAFNGVVAKYYELQDAQRAKQEDDDVAYKLASEDALRKDWQGADFRRNLTAVNNLISTWPEDLGTALLAARDPNGRKLGDNPVLIKQLASLALELNPAATLVPSGTTDAGKDVQARIAEIRKINREKPEEYNADKNLQKEYLDLLEVDAKMKSRGKAA